MSKSIKSIFLGLAGATILATAANAGGLERSTFNAGLLFEKGTYIEGSLAYIMPNITSDAPGLSLDINPDFSQINIGAKMDVHERIAIAFQTYEPSGADISYGAPIGLNVDINTRAYILSAKGDLGKGFSVFGGVGYYTAKAKTTNLLAPFILGDIDHGSDGSFGWLGGVAYERPEIALRVSLTYESGADFDLGTSGVVSGVTTAAIPEAVTLNFQSGIASKTIIFGSIRHVMHSKANIVVPVGGQVTDFSDSTTYTLGLGRQVTEKIAATISGAYEAGNGKPSTFAPTGDKFTLSLGGRYDFNEQVSLSAGVSHTWLGDGETAASAGSIPFKENSAWAVGTKIGIRF